VRTIDWNVSARMNEAFVKVFVEEREMTVMLVVDLSPSERFGTRRANKVRVASEVAALLAFSAIRNNDRVGLILSTSKIERIVAPKKGEKHVMRVIREILGFDAQLDPPKRIRDKRGAPFLGARTAFIVSDFFAQGHERALALAAVKHDIIPVALVDPRDLTLPDVGLATFEDLESGESILVDTSDSAVVAHHANAMKKLVAERRQLFNKLGLDSVEIETGGSFVAPLRDLFARRARRMRTR
jgi:uncharacterized protein (DUF58 family)